MNRRDFLKRAFAATAAGVLVPTQVIPALAAEPERRFWSLDRTMLQPERTVLVTTWFDASMAPFTTTYTVGDYTLRAADPWVIAQHIKVPPTSPWGLAIDGNLVADPYPYVIEHGGDKWLLDQRTVWKVLDETGGGAA